jgi:hypothetical protein
MRLRMRVRDQRVAHVEQHHPSKQAVIDPVVIHHRARNYAGIPLRTSRKYGRKICEPPRLPASQASTYPVKTRGKRVLQRIKRHVAAAGKIRLADKFPNNAAMRLPS